MNISFTKPYIDDNIINSVIETLRSGWITTGPKVIQLEKKICDLFNVNHCLCLNSWTNAAETILKWYGIKENDEVIVPVMTYCATANIVLHCNAKVIMIDVNDNMTININKIKEKITNKTKVIIPVDIGGLSCEYDKIIELVNSEEVKSKFSPDNENQIKMGRILILSDAAHSIGSKYKNKYACNYADFTVFSFHAVKNITTAEGGAICFNLPEPFNNEDIYKYFKIFTLHGQTKTAMDKYVSNASKHNYWKYDIIEAGYKYNMPDILACIALEQLKIFENLINLRRNICIKYYNNLSKYSNLITIPFSLDDLINSSCHLFIVRINNYNEDKRDRLINAMSDLNIMMNVHFKPLPLLSLYKNLSYNIENYDNSNKIYQNIVSLPLHYELTDNQIEYVCFNLINLIEP